MLLNVTGSAVVPAIKLYVPAVKEVICVSPNIASKQ